MDKSKCETMYNIRLKKIAVYVYKCLHKITPPFLHDTFQIKTNPYSMRSSISLTQPKVNTVAHGLQSFFYHGAKIWNQLPENIKIANNLVEFKKLLSKYDKPLCKCSYCSLVQNL